MVLSQDSHSCVLPARPDHRVRKPLGWYHGQLPARYHEQRLASGATILFPHPGSALSMVSSEAGIRFDL